MSQAREGGAEGPRHRAADEATRAPDVHAQRRLVAAGCCSRSASRQTGRWRASSARATDVAFANGCPAPQRSDINRQSRLALELVASGPVVRFDLVDDDP